MYREDKQSIKYFLKAMELTNHQRRKRGHGPVVWALGLLAVAPCSNPVLTSGQDIFPIILS